MEILFGYIYCLLIVPTICYHKTNPVWGVMQNPLVRWVTLAPDEDLPNGTVLAGEDANGERVFVVRHFDTDQRTLIGKYEEDEKTIWFPYLGGATFEETKNEYQILQSDYPLIWQPYEGEDFINFAILAGTSSHSQYSYFICRGKTETRPNKMAGVFITGRNACLLPEDGGAVEDEDFDILITKIEEEDLMNFFNGIKEEAGT